MRWIEKENYILIYLAKNEKDGAEAAAQIELHKRKKKTVIFYSGQNEERNKQSTEKLML